MKKILCFPWLPCKELPSVVLTLLPAAYLLAAFHSATLDSCTYPSAKSAKNLVRPWEQKAHSITDLPLSFAFGDLDRDDVELPEMVDLAHVVLGVEHLEVASQESSAQGSSAPEMRFDKAPHLTESSCVLSPLLGPVPDYVALPAWPTNFHQFSLSCWISVLPR